MSIFFYGFSTGMILMFLVLKLRDFYYRKDEERIIEMHSLLLQPLSEEEINESWERINNLKKIMNKNSMTK